MWILSRKLNEEFALNESIRIKIVEVNEGRVRIGITAPDGTRVCRTGPGAESEAVELDCEPMIVADDLAAPV